MVIKHIQKESTEAVEWAVHSTEGGDTLESSINPKSLPRKPSGSVQKPHPAWLRMVGNGLVCFFLWWWHMCMVSAGVYSKQFGHIFCEIFIVCKTKFNSILWVCLWASAHGVQGYSFKMIKAKFGCKTSTHTSIKIKLCWNPCWNPISLNRWLVLYYLK